MGSVVGARVGRGVAAWVNAHGRNLYVWTEPWAGGAWHARADVEPPAGVEFDRDEDVWEFNLWLERGASFSTTVRVNRRWFGVRDGISVTSGAVLSADIAPFV
jgi:hypothetical protein